MNLGPWSERRFYGPAPGDILGYGPSWRTGMGYGPDAAMARARSLLGPDWGPTPGINQLIILSCSSADVYVVVVEPALVM